VNEKSNTKISHHHFAMSFTAFIVVDGAKEKKPKAQPKGLPLQWAARGAAKRCEA
jgi:hypothetical protein